MAKTSRRDDGQFLRYGSLLVGGGLLLVGTVTQLRPLQATGLQLETLALVLWTWTGLRTGEIHVRGSYCRRAEDPVWYWLLCGIQASAMAGALWLSVAVLRGSVTIP